MPDIGTVYKSLSRETNYAGRIGYGGLCGLAFILSEPRGHTLFLLNNQNNTYVFDAGFSNSKQLNCTSHLGIHPAHPEAKILAVNTIKDKPLCFLTEFLEDGSALISFVSVCLGKHGDKTVYIALLRQQKMESILAPEETVVSVQTLSNSSGNYTHILINRGTLYRITTLCHFTSGFTQIYRDYLGDVTDNFARFSEFSVIDSYCVGHPKNVIVVDFETFTRLGYLVHSQHSDFYEAFIENNNIIISCRRYAGEATTTMVSNGVCLRYDGNLSIRTIGNYRC